jgi:hypothetical protein
MDSDRIERFFCHEFDWLLIKSLVDAKVDFERGHYVQEVVSNVR